MLDTTVARRVRTPGTLIVMTLFLGALFACSEEGSGPEAPVQQESGESLDLSADSVGLGLVDAPDQIREFGLERYNFDDLGTLAGREPGPSYEVEWIEDGQVEDLGATIR